MNTHPAMRHQTHLRIPGPTQLAILDTLQRAPFLRVEDLALELGVSESQSAAHLRLLEAGQYVAHVSRPTPIRPTTGNPVRLYLLTRIGLAILRKTQAEPDTRIPWWGTQDRRLLALLPRLDRLLVGHAFLHSLLVSAPRLLAERGRAARVRWTWIRDYQQTLPALPQQALAESRRLFADFLLVLQVKQQGVSDEQCYPLFLLLDHACLPMRQIRTRLLACVQARALANRLYPQAGERFPLVLILLPAWYRARHWQRLAAELARNGVDSLRGCLTVLPDTPFDGWRLPWQALHRYGPCENPRALLLPYPPEVCPALWHGFSHHGLETYAESPTESNSGEQARSQRAGSISLTKRLVRQLTSLQASGTWASVAPALVGLRVERAHYRMLELLCVAPLLTQAEIAAFLGIRETSAHHYIAEMRAAGCLESERLRDNDAQRFRLSSQGLQLLARRHHLQVRSLAFRQQNTEAVPVYLQKGLEKLRRNAPLTRGVYAFFARLTQEAATRGHRLLWWETGYAREQAYYSLARTAWRFEKPHGIGEYQAGVRRVRFWLEWHGDWSTSGNRLRALSTILVHYATYIRSREWSREGHVLPILLLVCPDGREHQIQDLARSQVGALRPLPIVLSTTCEQMEARGPLAPIWMPVLLPVGTPGSNRQAFYEIRVERNTDA